MLNKCRILKTVLLVGLMLLLTTNAYAADLTDFKIQSTSFAPGEECRYTIEFLSPAPLGLNLSVNAQIYVDFPKQFDIVKNGISSADPGCTLASIQYKNPKDKNYSILQGNVDVISDENFNRFLLTVNKGDNNTVSSGVHAYLVIPGVINAAMPGEYPVAMGVYDASNASYQGSTTIALGEPPQGIPEGLKLSAPGSTLINATWQPVEGATRYQLYYSTEPDGYYIQACDYGHEPVPGEQWLLTDTSCSYSGIGNGGLVAGNTYYFKVRAGNDYGFGGFSQTVEVTTPVINFKEKSYNSNAKLLKDIIIAKFDTPVQIVDQDKICIYKKSTGAPVVEKSIDVDNKKVTITATLEAGTEYQLVFYEGALAGDENQATTNNLMGWDFIARTK